MASHRTITSIVLLAQDVNLSIFRASWLEAQGIVSEKEIGDDYLFSSSLTRVPTSRFELLILPDRIQLRPTDPTSLSGTDIDRVLGGIVRSLPHTPFVACGINFEYVFLPSGDIATWINKAFSSNATKALIPATTPRCRTGALCTYEMDGFKVQLDMRSANMLKSIDKDRFAEGKEVVKVLINYHADFTVPDDKDKILRRLSAFETLAGHAEKQMEFLEALKNA